MNKVILLLCILISIILSQWTNFQANFVISSKPGLSGRLTGTVYYSLDNKAIRYTYNAGPEEIYRYDASSETGYFIYKRCSGSCDTIPLDRSIVMPEFYKGNEQCSGTVTTLNGQCTVCNKPSNDPVLSVCVNPGDNKPVRVTLRDGTVFDLSNVVSGASADQVDASLLGWGCVLNCDNVMDIVIVVDESGSIDGNYIPPNAPTGEWAQIRSFAIGFTNLFSIASNKVNMGLVQFGTGSRKILSSIISDENQYRQTVNGLTKCRGTNCNVPPQSTYTGCGIIDAVDLLLDQGGGRILRKNVPKVIVLVTDGVDTQPDDPFTWAGKTWSNKISASNSWLSYAKNNGIKIIAVGVGDGIDYTFLNSIASTAADGVTKLSYLANTFDFLSSSSVINKLGNLVCSATGSTNPCPGCAGLCACGVCTCPDSCEDNSACTIGTCNTTVNNQGGCFFSPVKCDDGDACTADLCNPTTGCVSTPRDIPTYCDDKNPCTTDTCDKSIGCINIPMDCRSTNSCLIGSVCQNGVCSKPTDICNDDNACTEDCAGSPNCIFKPLDCTGGNKCILPDCDPLGAGCKNTSRNCDDGNACSKDTCDPKIGCKNDPITCDDGDACTDDSCDPDSGCVFTPFDVTERCYKGDICSIYTCDKTAGCVATPIICPNTYNDSCVITICDPFQGCIPAPYVCNATGKDPNCFITYCNSSSTDFADRCYSQELDSCLIAKIAASSAVVLSIGAIIGIIIAAVVCAAGTTVGAYIGITKGYSGVFENKSGIYEPETIQVKNEAYGRDSVFNQRPVKPL
jgi:hypothetical protein